ncbi:hypothetical protein EMIT0232MI5_130167 [Pseudomonas sp. IT-232MI5]
MRGEAIAGFLETVQRGVAFDRDVIVFETLDQQPFMFILREDFDERVGRQAFADAVQRQLRDRFAIDPEIRRRHPMAVAHNSVGEVQLPVQLKGARLHRQRSRSGAGRGGFIDDAHAYAEFAQPQGQHQPGRAGADDQDVAAVHGTVLRLLCSKYGSAGAGGQLIGQTEKGPAAVGLWGLFSGVRQEILVTVKLAPSPQPSPPRGRGGKGADLGAFQNLSSTWWHTSA